MKKRKEEILRSKEQGTVQGTVQPTVQGQYSLKNKRQYSPQYNLQYIPQCSLQYSPQYSLQYSQMRFISMVLVCLRSLPLVFVHFLLMKNRINQNDVKCFEKIYNKQLVLIGKKDWRLHQRRIDHNHRRCWNILRFKDGKCKTTKSISSWYGSTKTYWWNLLRRADERLCLLQKMDQRVNTTTTKFYNPLIGSSNYTQKVYWNVALLFNY